MSTYIDTILSIIQYDELNALIDYMPYIHCDELNMRYLNEAAAFDSIACMRYLVTEGAYVSTNTLLVTILHRSLKCLAYLLQQRYVDVNRTIVEELVYSGWRDGFKLFLKYRHRDLDNIVELCIKFGNVDFLRLVFRARLHRRRSTAPLFCDSFRNKDSLKCLKMTIKKGIFVDISILYTLNKYYFYLDLQEDIWWRVWIAEKKTLFHNKKHAHLLDVVWQTSQFIASQTSYIANILNDVVSKDVIQYIVSSYI